MINIRGKCFGLIDLKCLFNDDDGGDLVGQYPSEGRTCLGGYRRGNAMSCAGFSGSLVRAISMLLERSTPLVKFGSRDGWFCNERLRRRRTPGADVCLASRL